MVFRSEGRWDGLRTGDRTVTSSLTRVECLRTLDRARLNREVPEMNLEVMRTSLAGMLDMCERIDVDSRLLARASEPLPSVLGALDGVHLASARIWQEAQGANLVMVTHDHALARAARLMGLEVAGA